VSPLAALAALLGPWTGSLGIVASARKNHGQLTGRIRTYPATGKELPIDAHDPPTAVVSGRRPDPSSYWLGGLSADLSAARPEVLAVNGPAGRDQIGAFATGISVLTSSPISVLAGDAGKMIISQPWELALARLRCPAWTEGEAGQTRGRH
jgi:hypothetical protein